MNAYTYAETLPDELFASTSTKSCASWFVTTYPAVHPDSRRILRIAGSRHESTKRSRTPARATAGTSTPAIATMPAVVPSPSSNNRPRSLRTRGDVGDRAVPPGGAEGEDEERADDDDVVDDRRERGGDEPVARVEQRAARGS